MKASSIHFTMSSTNQDCVYGLPIGTTLNWGNGIVSNGVSILFVLDLDADGGRLGLLPYSAKGRFRRQDIGVINAHSCQIADFTFAPFDPEILSTCAQAEDVKIWRIDPNQHASQATAPSLLLPARDAPAKVVKFHSTARNLLTVGAGKTVSLWDLNASSHCIDLKEFDDSVQDISWHIDGKLLATIDQSRQAKLFDPRSNLRPHACASVHGLVGKEARVLFLGDEGKVLTAGFTRARCREILLFDLRNLSRPLHAQTFDTSNSILIPMYDPDTKLLFLVGKGSNRISMFELSDGNLPLIEGSSFTGESVSLGACMVPKHSVDVMRAEVVRLLQLHRQGIAPISYVVPRKSYREFHSDLYPATTAYVASLVAEDWLAGRNDRPPRFSLNPASGSIPAQNQSNFVKVAPDVTVPKNSSSAAPILCHENRNGTRETLLQSSTATVPAVLSVSPPKPAVAAKPIVKPLQKSQFENASKVFSSLDDSQTKVPIKKTIAKNPERIASPEAKLICRDGSFRNSRNFQGIRTSIFRHILVTASKEHRITNLRNLNTRLPLEATTFAANSRWCALSLSGCGGLVAVFDANKPSKIPDGVIPGLSSSSNVVDFQFCPFKDDLLAVASEDGYVRLWRIPSTGISSSITEAEYLFQASEDKLTTMRWHPLAEDIIVTATVNGIVKIWNLKNINSAIELEDHHIKILALAWSCCGQFLSTLSKDGWLRIFNVRLSQIAIRSEKLDLSGKAARIVFVCNDEHLLVSSFNKSSERVLCLYRVVDLTLVCCKKMEMAPQLLVAHYDFDTSIVFLMGKGERLVRMFEIVADPPAFLELSPYVSPVPFQAIAFQPKVICDVRSVEISRAFRLDANQIELLSFTIPRVKKDLFQNDVFPDSLATWKAIATSDVWFSGKKLSPVFVCLKPADMESLFDIEERRTQNHAIETSSDTTTEISTNDGVVSLLNCVSGGDQASIAKISPMEQIVDSINTSLSAVEHKSIEQDKMEGVEDKEWED